jgi:hypothetical protein
MGAESIIAATFEDEAVARATVKGIHFIANAHFLRPTDACSALCYRHCSYRD